MAGRAGRGTQARPASSTFSRLHTAAEKTLHIVTVARTRLKVRSASCRSPASPRVSWAERGWIGPRALAFEAQIGDGTRELPAYVVFAAAPVNSGVWPNRFGRLKLT